MNNYQLNTQVPCLLGHRKSKYMNISKAKFEKEVTRNDHVGINIEDDFSLGLGHPCTHLAQRSRFLVTMCSLYLCCSCYASFSDVRAIPTVYSSLITHWTTVS